MTLAPFFIIFVCRFVNNAYFHYTVMNLSSVQIISICIILIILTVTYLFFPQKLKEKLSNFNKGILNLLLVQKFLVGFMSIETYLKSPKSQVSSIVGIILMMTCSISIIRVVFCLVGEWEFLWVDFFNVTIYLFIYLYVQMRNKWINYGYLGLEGPDVKVIDIFKALGHDDVDESIKFIQVSLLSISASRTKEIDKQRGVRRYTERAVEGYRIGRALVRGLFIAASGAVTLTGTLQTARVIKDDRLKMIDKLEQRTENLQPIIVQTETRSHQYSNDLDILKCELDLKLKKLDKPSLFPWMSDGEKLQSEITMLKSQIDKKKKWLDQLQQDLKEQRSESAIGQEYVHAMHGNGLYTIHVPFRPKINAKVKSAFPEAGIPPTVTELKIVASKELAKDYSMIGFIKGILGY